MPKKITTTEEIAETVNLFEQGKYSEYIFEHKEAVVSFLKRSGVTNYETVEKVLRKDDGLRKQMEKDLKCEIPEGNELSSKPDLETEIFTNYVSEVKINNEDVF